MANAAHLVNRAPARIMLVGYPGAGKTGSLASLANAGFKLRILDFDGNLDPLLLNTKPEFLPNIDILRFEDRLGSTGKFIEPVGIPSAFSGAFKAMDSWKYTDEQGTVVDLGASRDWGPDTIVILDSLTAMGDAAMNRARKLMNKTLENTSDRVWGLAMGEQNAFIKRLTASENKHHTIVLAHLKMIGPKDIRAGDSQLTTDIKQQVANLIPTRLFPSALGWQLPQSIGAEFPTLLEVKVKYNGTKVRRVISSAPREELDVKMPALGGAAELDIADGLLHILRALSPESVRIVETGVWAQSPTLTKPQEELKNG